MLALPGDLASMQNQAIECYLSNVDPSPQLNQKLKQLVEKKPVIIRVENLKNNRYKKPLNIIKKTLYIFLFKLYLLFFFLQLCTSLFIKFFIFQIICTNLRR